MGPSEQSEIEEATLRALGRMGVQGALMLSGKSIELRIGSGAPVSIDITSIAEQWRLLPEENRQRKAEEVAHRLVAAARLAGGGVVEREMPLDDSARKRLLGAGISLFVLLVAIGAWRFVLPLFTTEEKPPPPESPGESDTARSERLARACDAVRDRIYKGSSFGPFALEGFAVELWLAGPGPSLREHPAVSSLLAGKRLAPAADDKLAGILDGTIELADGFPTGAARQRPGWSAVTLVFSGGYARAFFQEEQRPRFLGLAERVAAASGASHGALYARCAHLRTHDVGVWFRGPDLPGAAAALVYQMGLFSEAKMIDRHALAAFDVPSEDGTKGGSRPPGSPAPFGAAELVALEKAASGAEASIPSLVGAAGGAVTSGKPTTLTFALAAPVRAVGAARDLARRMGVGVPPSE